MPVATDKKTSLNLIINPWNKQTNKGGVAAWADVPKGTLGNLTPADRHGSVQVRSSLFASVFCSPSLFLYLFDVFLIDIITKHLQKHTHRHFHRHLIWIFILKTLHCRYADLNLAAFFLHGDKLLCFFFIINNWKNGIQKTHFRAIMQSNAHGKYLLWNLLQARFQVFIFFWWTKT